MARPLPFKPLVVAGGRSQPPRPRRLLGEALVQSGALAREALDGALARQQEQDAPLGRILLAEQAVSADALATALATQAELPLVDLAAMPPDPALTAGLDPYLCLRLEALPWRQIGRTRVVAVTSPAAIEEAARVFGGDARQVAVVLVRPEALRAAIQAGFGLRLRDDATTRCPPALSCRGIASRSSRRRALCVAAGGGAALALAPWLVLQALVAWVLVMNLLTTALRGFALFARFRAGRVRLEAANVPRLADFKRLPTVSLIVPLKGEAAVAGNLIRALDRIDYPRALLDIKLVLEEKDLPTRLAVERAGLPPSFEVLTVPEDPCLQTKPRALNYALPFCRGTIIGVYDAEDRPPPDQIRVVVQALAEAPPEVACVQGYLDFYNHDQNWLARCFTADYAMWFRIVLHGVQRLGIPIPLGGTTVFFRRRPLEEVGAWDAHNVTEDADLGMRLARFGYRTEMIRSVTLEEANCRTWRWIGQRSRWLKGYAITWASHMRAPRRLLADLGPRGFLGFQILFLGGITSYLSIPLFWAAWAATLGFGLEVWAGVPRNLLAAVALTLLAGQALSVAVAVMALRDAGRMRMLPWLVCLLAYWPLGAVAAYRAVAEAFLRPFHWEKTEHGLAGPGAEVPPPGQPAAAC